VLLGYDLDTPLPLWDVFPASLRVLQLRNDGAKLSSLHGLDSYWWDTTLSLLGQYLEWREGNCSPSMGVALERICLDQRGAWLDVAVVEELQQKGGILGIIMELK
jgi:hypothetical protein